MNNQIVHCPQCDHPIPLEVSKDTPIRDYKCSSCHCESVLVTEDNFNPMPYLKPKHTHRRNDRKRYYK